MLGSSAKDFGASLGLIDDDDQSMPKLGSSAYQKLRVNKLMDEDCISMRNEPIDPLETVEDMTFELGDEGQFTKQSKRLPFKQATVGNPQTQQSSSNYLDQMDSILQNEDAIEMFPDTVSQSSSISRASSFKKAGFGSLVQNQDEEQALDNFFAAERHYLILTNAGKPVYSMVGDIYALAPIFATLYAIVSKAQTY